ncbi:MAG: DUF3568 family protein [Victivallales bacterium]|jgi:hypothetical protein|nr:DUF3568 family protein [Victivallales bacterium]
MKKMLFLLVVAALMLTATSCSTTTKSAAQSTTAENYRFGVYTAVIPCNLFDADKAVRAMGKRAKFLEMARRNKYNHIEYLYRDFYDNKLSITIWDTGDGSTKIQIKVGKLGDKASSEEILVAIDEELRVDGYPAQ